MKKSTSTIFLVLSFLLLGISLFAQNQRFIYEYTFVQDSLNKSEIGTEQMFLDITKDGSKFYSRDVFLQDSIMMADFEKQIKATGAMNVISKPQSNKANFKNKIFKEYPNYNIFLETRLGRDLFKVADNRPIVWEVLAEKEKIGEFDAQKATTEMFGRKWTAWFTTKLPFQDGPYKFHGLPGLIVKMEDASKTHVFELKGISKFNNVSAEPSEFNRTSKAVEINEQQYKKLFKEDRSDPAKSMKQMFSSGMMTGMKDANGSSISTGTMIKNIEKMAAERNAKNNNLIELDLLKK
ncbi:GLPGLI family protein [Frigoriflavimonas asaccharolytica]|uniref:GLPGLI family protein n=1 Tax=Frigoriflavimonas asaccharolytica TaxID=2735899 RepID=A0A8J8G7T8_9FLAO|nr:GLPGLI family protein [Frigoriflavimonas asaccharolytica]NRS92904.1 GLPGLI family protein [Frigoriflavimonas asaccharolytica]